MRLTCPSCGAQYEIDDDLVPPGGRDVQCSNCGATWLQAAAGEGGDAPEADAPASPDAPPMPKRRRPDEAVLDVLRQEREHEARIRAAEAARTGGEDSAAPARPDDPQARGAQERARMAAAAERARARDRSGPSDPPAPAKADGKDPAPEAPADTDAPDKGGEAAKPGGVIAKLPFSRRQLLPDIEEINSTLHPEERAAEQEGGDPPEAPDPAPSVGSGFRLGFSVVALIATLFVLAYGFAPAIAEGLPFLAEPMRAYVGWIDGMRVAIDAGAGRLADWLTPAAEG